MNTEQVTSMTGAVSFDAIVVGIAAVAAYKVLPKVAVAGARMVLGMIR